MRTLQAAAHWQYIAFLIKWGKSVARQQRDFSQFKFIVKPNSTLKKVARERIVDCRPDA